MTFTKIEQTDVKDGDHVVVAYDAEIIAGIARRLAGCESATIHDDLGQLRFLKFACEIYKIRS